MGSECAEGFGCASLDANFGNLTKVTQAAGMEFRDVDEELNQGI